METIQCMQEHLHIMTQDLQEMSASDPLDFHGQHVCQKGLPKQQLFTEFYLFIDLFMKTKNGND